jgi:hypothetical protein
MTSQAPVAHACNPSYSGGRDQEDHCSKPAQANSLRAPISKKPITKKRAGTEFKSQYPKGEKKSGFSCAPRV